MVKTDWTKILANAGVTFFTVLIAGNIFVGSTDAKTILVSIGFALVQAGLTFCKTITEEEAANTTTTRAATNKILHKLTFL